MNRHNANIKAFAVQQLELKASDHVLEIGFGGGVGLRSLVGKAAFVGGVDLSREMAKWPKAKFSTEIAAGRADFREGTVEAIPSEKGSFDKAFTVNSVYFWRSLERGFREIHRVLAPGGRLVVGMLPKEWLDQLGHATDIFTAGTSDEVISALTTSGFKRVRVERPAPTTRWVVIIAAQERRIAASPHRAATAACFIRGGCRNARRRRWRRRWGTVRCSSSTYRSGGTKIVRGRRGC